MESCKFWNFREGFIFVKLCIFTKLRICEVSRKKSSRNGEITLSFTDEGKSCPSRYILKLQICLLTLFPNINSSKNFPIYSSSTDSTSKQSCQIRTSFNTGVQWNPPYFIWWLVTSMQCIRESPPQFENRIMAQVYVRSITHSTMYQKAPFC